MKLVVEVGCFFLAYGVFWFSECQGFGCIRQRAGLWVCVWSEAFYNANVTLWFMKCMTFYCALDTNLKCFEIDFVSACMFES
jgi:hypothetical protein